VRVDPYSAEELVMRTVLLTLVVCLLPGVARADDPAKAEKPSKVWAGIGVGQPLFVQGEKAVEGPFQINFTLVNDGDAAIDPEIGSSRLLVNGKELKDWAFIVGQGPRDDRWKSLPAGDHISFGYAMGEYFNEPGVYKVSWKGKGFESPEVVFRVMPKKARRNVPPARQEKGLADAERLKLLKPVMTLDEVNRLFEGKTLLGQTCGTALDKDGKERGAYGNVYELKLPGAREPQAMKFSYIQGEDGYLHGFRGPGFRYVRKDGKYVAAEVLDPETGKPRSEKYAAYWLTGDPVKDRGDYPVLLLARLPIDDLAANAGLHHLLGKKPEEHPPLLDAPALTITTYKKDSIWNADRLERPEGTKVLHNSARPARRTTRRSGRSRRCCGATTRRPPT
jgi:hypothetical protein